MDFVEVVVAAAACSVVLSSEGNVMVLPLREPRNDEEDEDDPLLSHDDEGVSVGVDIGVTRGSSVIRASVGMVSLNT